MENDLGLLEKLVNCGSLKETIPGSKLGFLTALVYAIMEWCASLHYRGMPKGKLAYAA
jgi:hypothetical protein